MDSPNEPSVYINPEEHALDIARSHTSNQKTWLGSTPQGRTTQVDGTLDTSNVISTGPKKPHIGGDRTTTRSGRNRQSLTPPSPNSHQRSNQAAFGANAGTPQFGRLELPYTESQYRSPRVAGKADTSQLVRGQGILFGSPDIDRPTVAYGISSEVPRVPPKPIPRSPPISDPGRRHAKHKGSGGSRQHSSPPLDLILQPPARSISQDQLIAEVKGIYAGLVMIEAKCIEVDALQASIAEAAEKGNGSKSLTDDQYRSLIALHKTLLQEHHDFLLASQHPSASEALRNLAAKYAMPARMWRHGIHSLLELMRTRLEESLEHMFTFIYVAYSMMTLLFETVKTFEPTWIECMGDLARYRMAIEERDALDRDVWTLVSRTWYTKAGDKSPSTGRLYHHLAILARPHLLQQLFFYTKSLSVSSPFLSSRDSILTLLQPVANSQQSFARSAAVDLTFIKAHAVLFSGKSLENASPFIREFESLLDAHIGMTTERWKEHGVYVATANFVAMLAYGSEESFFRKRLRSNKGPREASAVDLDDMQLDTDPSLELGKLSTEEMDLRPQQLFTQARDLTMSALRIAVDRIGDANVYPHVHVSLVFVRYVFRFPDAKGLLEKHIPWQPLATMLNTWTRRNDPQGERVRAMDGADFPQPQETGQPLTEDFHLRGFDWADEYFPEGFFKKALEEEDDARTLEKPSMAEDRIRRILWLARVITLSTDFLIFDNEKKLFSTSQFDTPNMPLRGPKDRDIKMLGNIAEPLYLGGTSSGARTLLVLETNFLISSSHFLPRIAASHQYEFVILDSVIDQLKQPSAGSMDVSSPALSILNQIQLDFHCLSIMSVNGHTMTHQVDFMGNSGQLESVEANTVHRDTISLAKHIMSERSKDQGLPAGRSTASNVFIVTEEDGLKSAAWGAGVLTTSVAAIEQRLSGEGESASYPPALVKRGTHTSLQDFEDQNTSGKAGY